MSSPPPSNFNSDSGERDERRKKKEEEERDDSYKNKYKSVAAANENNNKNSKVIDPHFKRILWHLICSTRGGANRAKILAFLMENPSNANQISIQLKLDYKTIGHHLVVLIKNNLIMTENEESYGATYFISPLLEKNQYAFNEIMAKIGIK